MATSYFNPTNIPQSNQTFGSSDQFNVEPFMQPFPFEQQKAENEQYNQDFTGWLSGLETPEQTRERFENRYGYRDLAENYFRTQESASDVMNAIKAAPENIQSRLNTAGTVTTAAQKSNIVNKEVGELMETYNNLASIGEQQGRRLAAIEQNLNQAAALEMAQQQKMMTPWLQKYETNAIMQAREYSGWTFASQLELNRLLANQQAGFNWTNSEAQRANYLAGIEKEFEWRLKLQESQNSFYEQWWKA